MADFEIFAEDCGFPEGPVACDDGSVLFGELRSGSVIRAWAGGRKEVVATTRGATAGLAIGPDGALYCCNNGGFVWGALAAGTNHPLGLARDYTTGSIERIDLATGKVERLYDSCDGIALAGPNDIVFDSDGGMWFTDLGVNAGDHEKHGGVYYAKADGSSIRRIAYGMGMNGIGLSPDGSTVYAACSFQRNLLAFDANVVGGPPAELPTTPEGITAEQGFGPVAGRIVASFPNLQILDSLAIEADGTIAQAVVVGAEGIARVNSADGSVQWVNLPDYLTTNVAFGGADMRDGFATLSSSSRIAKVRWPAPGLRLKYNC